MPGIDPTPDPAASAAIQSANELIGLLPDPEVLQRWVNRALGVQSPRLDALVGSQLTANLLAGQQQSAAKQPDAGKPTDIGSLVQVGQLGPLLAAMCAEEQSACPPRTDPATEDEMTAWAQNAEKVGLADLMSKFQDAIGSAEKVKPDAAAVSELQLGRLSAVLQAGLGLTDAPAWREAGADPQAFRDSVGTILQTLADSMNSTTAAAPPAPPDG